MSIKLESMGSLCCLEYSKNNELNGIHIDEDDFGQKFDRDPENAEEYGCGNMRFTRAVCRPEVLEKYGITKGEYDMVCDQLEEVLSFGSCGWCV